MTDTSDPIACDLFEYAPISLWEEDYSGVKAYLEQLRAEGVTDLRAYLAAHPEAVGEGINYALDGQPLEIRLHWAVLPGSEHSLEHVLISIEDITARKKAEDYLKYLGTHDVLTGLYNRAYFEDQLARLGRGRQFPVSLIVADLDGLKGVNDQRGHAEGDKLIRRAGEVLQASVRAEDVVTRVGGDEFAVLLPSANGAAAAQALARIRSLIELNNKYHGAPSLNLSLGAATGEMGSNLSEVLRQADDQMYVEKRAHHGR